MATSKEVHCGDEAATVLRILRAATGRDQAEVARAAGMHRVSLCRLESGRRPVRPETFRRLVEAIGMPGEER